jgi:hypothetical protein
MAGPELRRTGAEIPAEASDLRAKSRQLLRMAQERLQRLEWLRAAVGAIRTRSRTP